MCEQACLHEETLFLLWPLRLQETIQLQQAGIYEDDFAHWNKKAKGSFWDTVGNPLPFVHFVPIT